MSRTSVTRKIYIEHFGKIPKDSDGRSYEIHHIDGNWKNNDPSNLKAVSIQEHYDIHYAQNDWGACSKIAGRLKMTTEEISELSRRQQKQLVESGKHHLTGDGEFQRQVALSRVRNNTHNLQGERNPCHKMIKEGTWHTLKKQDGTSLSSDRVKNGTHHWLGGEQQRVRSRQMIVDGTHPWLSDKNPVYTQMANGTHALTGKNNPRFDPTIYKFKHDVTNEVEVMTQNEFVKKHNLQNHSGNLSAMIKGNRNVVKGWRIVRDS